MNNFKWIPLVGLDLSAANISAAEKLRRFGFAVNCGEFGSEKYTKADLCICDILQEKDDPNILIVAPSGELYSWYKVLVTTIGADFKIVTEASNALLFFNKCGASLFIISRDALFGENVLKKKAPDDFLWDLVIIDEEQNLNVPEYSKYENNLIWKSERLLINTPRPVDGAQSRQALCSLIKSVLKDSELSDAADDIDFGAGSSGLNIEDPVMRYFDISVYKQGGTRNIEFVDYGFEESVLQNLRRRVDLRSGLPVYRFGGNVFEDYDCEKFDEERRIYQKRSFSRSDVEDLRLFDKKLDSLLNVCEQTLSDSGRMMIYCCDKNTCEYLHKALTCLYGADVHYARGGMFRSEDITRVLSVKDDGMQPKILIGMDDLGTVGEGFDEIDCIVNYELPLSPDLLERRMTRHGVEREAKRKFVIFRDSNKLFDTCVLEKTLYLQTESGYCGELPTRNILMDIGIKGECLSDLVSDLKYISNIAKQEDNCLDLIKRVKCEYAVPEAEKINSGKTLAEFADNMLKRIFGLFGLSGASSPKDIAAAVNGLDGLCVVSGGALQKAPGIDAMASSFESGVFTNEPFASEAIPQLAEAKKRIDELHKDEKFHLRIKEEITKLNDCIQYPVLFGIWKYRAKEQDSDRSFADYIKIYNDGL